MLSFSKLIVFFIRLFSFFFKWCNYSLRYPHPEDRIVNRAVSDISDVLRETSLTISDYIEIVSPVESERVVSHSKKEITELTRFKNPIFRARIP